MEHAQTAGAGHRDRHPRPVTVSMAELTSGTRSRILRVSWLDVSAVAGTTSEAAGNSRTSSKVSPSMAILLGRPRRYGTGLPSAMDIGAASISGRKQGPHPIGCPCGITAADRLARPPPQRLLA